MANALALARSFNPRIDGRAHWKCSSRNAGRQCFSAGSGFQPVICGAGANAGRMKEFASRNFPSLVLLGGMSFGLLQPEPGRIAQRLGFSKWAASGIFLLSGLSLQDEDLADALRAWPCGLLALVSILFITPMVARLFLLRINLTPRELVTGLAVFCCAPTTISSGVTLTQLAGANKALALAITVASNCLGIVTMPFMVSALIARGLGVQVPAHELLTSMLQTLLLPLLIGRVLRDRLPGVRTLIDKNRHTVAMVSATLLSTVPWMQVSSSRTLLLRVQARSLLASAILGIGLHLVFLFVNYLLLAYLSGRSDDKSSTRAAVLVASQKTLPVSVAVIDGLNNQLGEAGLLLLPCISTHFLQIIIDTMLVNHWLQRDAEAEKDHVFSRSSRS